MADHGRLKLTRYTSAHIERSRGKLLNEQGMIVLDTLDGEIIFQILKGDSSQVSVAIDAPLTVSIVRAELQPDYKKRKGQ